MEFHFQITKKLNWGSPGQFSRYKRSKLKSRSEQSSSIVAMVTDGDKIIVVLDENKFCNRVIHKFCYDVGLIFCSFLSKFTYSKNLKTGTIHLKIEHCVQIHGSQEVSLKYYITGCLKLFQNSHGKTHPTLLKDVDLCLEM